MKRSILIAAALSAMPALAAPGDTQADKDAACKSWGDLAAVIMKLRQTEAPMSEAIKGTGDDSSRRLIIEAYKEPAYLSEDGQARAVDRFRNEIELACFQSQ
ncbi:hypothetical protein GCM10011491_05560 [Brucella endophytica]|uniref:Uncharacterized protein n=1 Tax=Brucella endophytica TaxID=1963359 RepID=A0A916S2N9_9HYPH|nr:hypothetical protein [Brucella endophytica]GGA81161.1 hypothetical protein GCM10011491_05560 [Brucella endophytica]